LDDLFVLADQSESRSFDFVDHFSSRIATPRASFSIIANVTEVAAGCRDELGAAGCRDELAGVIAAKRNQLGAGGAAPLLVMSPQ
jgi:hypothetical protein